MYHIIEFVNEFVINLEISSGCRIAQIIRRGTRVQAQIKPYVAETEVGPIEVADLFLADGTALLRVPFELFSFVDEMEASDEFSQ